MARTHSGEFMFVGTIVALLVAAEPGSLPPPPPAVAPIQAPLSFPTWSLGAGMFLVSDLQLGIAGLGGGTLASLAAPTVAPSVSLERAFSPQFAMGLGLQGSFFSTQSGGSETPTGSLGIGFSPRFVLTDPTAPVSFTFFTTVMIGYAGTTTNVNLTGMNGVLVSALTGSVAGGGALEIKLLERLALRVQASFLKFSVARTGLKASPMATEAVVTVTGVSVIPSPGLELRLYL